MCYQIDRNDVQSKDQPMDLGEPIGVDECVSDICIPNNSKQVLLLQASPFHLLKVLKSNWSITFYFGINNIELK